MKLNHFVSILSGCSFLFILFVTGSDRPSTELVFPNGSSTQFVANWSKWQQQAQVHEHSSKRSIRLLQVLQHASGIYANASKAKALGLSSTVMVTLLTLTDRASKDYKKVLKNWLCYTAHYQHKPLIYYTYEPTDNNPSTSLQTILDDMRQYNRWSHFIDFPNALFWQLLTKKTKWKGTHGDKWKLDYRGHSVSHAHFGSPLLKIVLMLEIVRNGYDCIYFDADIAFVKDPIPLMIIGQNTVSIAYESRSCGTFVRSQVTTKEEYIWKPMEPNGGIIYVQRQNQKGILFLETFVMFIINAHTSNDQYHLRAHAEGLYEVSTDCHIPYVEAYTTNQQYTDMVHQYKKNSTISTLATLCYLPDILFENGVFAFSCNKHNENQLRLNRYGRVGSPEGITTPPGSLILNTKIRQLWNNLTQEYVVGSLPIGANNDDFIAPVTVHANYCDHKSKCFSDRGLWLIDRKQTDEELPTTNTTLQSAVCRPYDIRQTAYRSRRWYESLLRTEINLRDLLTLYPVATILQFRRFTPLYVIDPGPILRPMTLTSFQRLGLTKVDITTPDPWESNILHEFMVMGSPLPDLTGLKLSSSCSIIRTNITNKDTTIFYTEGTIKRTTSSNFPSLYVMWKNHNFTC